ncbi:MAG: hypothetical protein M1829_002754 [Trizodia sp. TS-e1964]|nr:MAG: hypothetical protein M1829_002754 [Trizodia sp. TS-e1964]
MPIDALSKPIPYQLAHSVSCNAIVYDKPKTRYHGNVQANEPSRTLGKRQRLSLRPPFRNPSIPQAASLALIAFKAPKANPKAPGSQPPRKRPPPGPMAPPPQPSVLATPDASAPYMNTRSRQESSSPAKLKADAPRQKLTLKLKPPFEHKKFSAEPSDQAGILKFRKPSQTSTQMMELQQEHTQASILPHPPAEPNKISNWNPEPLHKDCILTYSVELASGDKTGKDRLGFASPNNSGLREIRSERSGIFHGNEILMATRFVIG